MSKKMNDSRDAEMLTTLEAFYARESQQADELCFTQPFADGVVREYTWAQAANDTRRVAAYLRSLDLEPGTRIALMSNNCAYWIMADLAIWLSGHVSVPIYPVLTGSSVKQILDHSGAQVMFAGKLDNWQDIQSGIDDGIQVVTFPIESSVPTEAGKAWNDILSEFDPAIDNPTPALDDLATIIYTSGTTGMPKGVMHTFNNLAIVGTSSGEMYSITRNDRKLSYLPLAHVAERAAVEVNQLYYGYQVYFSCSLDTFGEDLRRARPTLFFAVPRIWQKFQQQVLAHIPDKRLRFLLKVPVLSKRAKKKVLSGLGLEEMRVAVSGAAPLSTSLIDWYGSLGIEILEGYGMSENFAFSHSTKAGQSKVGYVGTPAPGVVCKLSKDGEILIKTPAATIGYYKEPGLTAELFDDDGYIRTGDKGEIDDKGRLRITGRIKELFKTSKGKYVAPAPIEDLLLQNQNIEQVCVTGADLPQPISLITLSEQSLQTSLTPEGKRSITDSLKQTVESANDILDKHENISCLVVISDQWSVETGIMTPTLKVKRAKIDDMYTPCFQQWLKSRELVFWADAVL
jgi:long-chain acyl-CoA synthetase